MAFHCEKVSIVFLESVSSFFFSYNCHYSGNRPHLNPFIMYFFPFCLLFSESFLQLFPNPSIEFFVPVSIVKCFKKIFFFTLVSASSIFTVFYPGFLLPVSSPFPPCFLLCVRVSVSLRAGVPSPWAVDWYQSVA